MKNAVYKKYIVTNMVRDKNKEAVQKMASALPMDYLGDIPRDQAIEDAVFKGESLMKLEKSMAIEYIFSLMDKIGGKNGDT